MAKKKDKTLYTEDSIKTLEGREHVRLRPGLYLGSNEYSTQLVKEVFYNANDEAVIGHGSQIIVKINTSSNTYSVIDRGQGFPINVSNGAGKTVLQSSFDTINTSGKFDDDGVYQGTATGLNGIGAKLTNFLSKWLEVISWNNGQYEHLWFEEGILKNREVGGTTTGDEPNGTTVTWQPDPQFFQNPTVNVNELRRLFKDMSAMTPNLTITLFIDNNEETFTSPGGLTSLVDERVSGKELLSNRFSIRKEEDGKLFDISMTYTSDYSDNITAYVNYGLTENGVHISTLKSQITKQVNKYAQDNNLLGKKDEKLTSAELSEGQTIVFNMKSRGVKYDSQTKVRVVDLDVSLLKRVISGDFAAWLKNNPKDAKLIIDRALNARKAREAAQNAKERIRNASSKGKKFISLPTKLVDAYSKDRTECELFITEGDSAANGLIAKRSGKTQAIFPIRGKILSCRKASMDKIYANQEISNIVKALGLDIEKETGKLVYNVKKLRYGKIIFACDADSDGYDIRLLLLNAFWWLCPELIENGHIWVAIPPLYRITDNKNNYIYLLDDNALDDYKKKHKSGYIINRMKGLGESSPDELALYLLREGSRNIQQIVSPSFKETDDLLECFMGSKVEPRREYLLNHYSDVEVNLG